MRSAARSSLQIIFIGMLAQAIGLPATISGRVLDNSSGLPLGGVEVRFVGDGTGYFMPGVRADATGRYELTVGSSATGIVSAGAPGSPGYATRRIAVRGNEDLTGIDLRGTAWGGISGRVLDEDGMPVAKAGVYLVSQRFDGSSLMYVLSSGANPTDEKGRYSFDHVAPGRKYWLMTWIQRAAVVTPGSEAESELRKAGDVFAYYPGGADMGASVVLAPGESRDGVDIRIRVHDRPSFCMDGKVQSGADAGPFNIRIEPSEVRPEYRFERVAGVTGPDRSFRVCGLAPGSWRILLERGGTSDYPAIQGEDVVTIGESDVHDIGIVTGSRVSVRVVAVSDTPRANEAPRDPGPEKISIGLRPVPFYAANFDRTISLPGTVVVDGLLPGELKAVTWGMEGRTYVKDIDFGGQSVLNENFRLLPVSGPPLLRIFTGHDGGFLHVQATDHDRNPQAGAWITVIPAEAITDAAVAASSVANQADQNGVWSSGGLKPGKYYVVACGSDPTQNPERITRLMVQRLDNDPVEITPGGDVSVSREEQY